MAYLSTISLCTAAAVALVSYIIYQRFYHPLAAVPGPFLASITRLWLVFQSRTLQRHRIEMALHEQYGKIVRISPNELCISDLSYVKTIYGANSRFLKADWYETVEPKDEDAMNLLGERDIEKYKHQRRLIGPLFTTQSVKNRENLLAKPILSFIEKMKGSKGQPIDMVKWMNILAIDLLTEITFSESLNYVQKGDGERNAEDVDDFWQQIHWAGLIPMFWRCYVWANEWIGKMGISPMFVANIGKLAIIKYYNTQIMARATEDLEKTLDHVDLAGDINRFVATRPEFKPQWAATITLHIISAGFDTLGMTLSSCIFWVSKTPGCQVKLLAELDKLRKDGETDDVPTYDQAVSLPYFQACITEAMRLTPVIGISLPRTVPSEGVDIGGYHLSPGDVVGMNPWIVHRNKELFGEDAEAFRPERYIEASESHRHAMESMSLSFGGPSRSCPGRYLAWLALSKTVAAIFQHFEIEILEDKEAKEFGGGFREDCFFVVKWYGIWMRLIPRT